MKAAVGQVREEYAFSQRRACGLLTVAVSIYRYQIRRSDEGLREECLNVSWFGNLYEARGKIAAWREDYNEERPHSSLGYRTSQEFARELSEKNGCEKDGGFAPVENASRFPLSHSHGGDGIATAVQVNGPDVVL